MRIFKCQPIKGTVQASIKKKKKTTVAVNAFSVKSLISHSIIPYKVMPVSYHGLTVAVHP